MAKRPLSSIQQALGRLLGASARKESDVTTTWREMCARIGENPTDRLLMLLTFDLEQGGINLADVKRAKVTGEMQEAFDQVSLAGEIGKIAQDFTQKTLAREYSHMDEIRNLSDEFEKMLKPQLKPTMPAVLQKHVKTEEKKAV